MSHERAPTSGGGVSTGDGAAVVRDRPRGEELDALFEVLADEQRRRILASLDECDGGVATFSDLTDAIVEGADGTSASGAVVADASTDADAGVASTDDRERVATRLHHAHLPKLAEAGLVEFDERSEVVRYRGGPVVSDWLELVRTD